MDNQYFSIMKLHPQILLDEQALQLGGVKKR